MGPDLARLYLVETGFSRLSLLDVRPHPRYQPNHVDIGSGLPLSGTTTSLVALVGVVSRLAEIGKRGAGRFQLAGWVGRLGQHAAA